MRKEKIPLKKLTTVTLKSVAQHVGLTPGTVSAILNDAPSARAIPTHTKERVTAAAKELNYRPNYFARSLRRKRNYTIGVIAGEIGGGYGSGIINGVERYLRGQNYFFLTVAHRHDPELLVSYSNLLVERGVEGFITVNTKLVEPPRLPTVAIGEHRRLENVTNIVIDHELAARLALRHLLDLGHRKIAFMRGHPDSPDAEDRWHALCKVTREMAVPMNPDLIVQIEIEVGTPHLGYPYAKQLLKCHKPFTALFAYNDISAIGAIRAFQEEGLRVPADIAVVGFDDIEGNEFQIPSLTTVRQPLDQMGQIAAKTLIALIEKTEDCPPQIRIAPELVVRESTGPVSNGAGKLH